MFPSNTSFVWKFVYQKEIYKGTRKQNTNSTLPLIASTIVIPVVLKQDWILLILV